jgi:hypothetical protein
MVFMARRKSSLTFGGTEALPWRNGAMLCGRKREAIGDKEDSEDCGEAF